ncbi:MAG TPA: hypothetical protein ENJ56_08050 [Anaerolineae bacterium]|nr:hypothetical protein [Anaerolineae bacterium]
MQKSVSTSSDYRYQSFLIRLWQDGERSQWRGSTKHVVTGEVLFFDNLENLFIYLLSQTEGAENVSD